MVKRLNHPDLIGALVMRRLTAVSVVIAFSAVVLGMSEGVARADYGPPVTFSAATEYPVRSAVSTAVADFDGDGVLDLAIGSDDAGPDAGVAVLLGDGAGAFGPATEFEIGGTGPRTVVARDLNRDTFPDLAVVNAWTGVSVLLGDGAGSFGPKADYETAAAPKAVAVADLNGDTFLDLASANWGDSVSVLLGDGAGRFGARTDFSTSGSVPVDLAIGDLNGDTLPDIAVVEDSNNVSVLPGDGTGSFGVPLYLAAGFRPTSLDLGDLNGDGRLDLVVTNAFSDTVAVQLANDRGRFNVRTEYPTARYPGSVVVADLNGDGHLDVSTSNPGSVTVLLGDGTGSVGARTDFAAGMGGSSGGRSLAAADLNHDGRLDLVRATSGSVSVLLNTTTFTPSAPLAPTILRNATASHEAAAVSWIAPVWNGGSQITGYVVTPYVRYSPRPSQTFDSTATTQTVTGLVNGTQYRFRVQAINAIGTSGYSTVTNPVIPAVTVPGSPTIIRNATAGDAEATVSWTAPASDGGSVITGYVVTPYVGFSPRPSQTFSSTATTQTVTGLVNGTQYRFRVQAINAVGTSGYSTVTNPVTPAA